MPSYVDHRPDVSGIYRFLKAMERKELVAGSWDLSETGPAKKCYQITPAGRRCLQEWIKTLENYRQQITRLWRAARNTSQR